MKIAAATFSFICLLKSPVEALNQCSIESGGGICPESNVCCPTGKNGISSCVTVPVAPNSGASVCCFDDGDGITGCGPGYKCESTTENGILKFYCRSGQDDKERPARLPRYQLCSLPRTILQHVHTLQINPDQPELPRLPYYSSIGPLDTVDKQQLSRTRQARLALIVIHGSARNADDYICCAVSALRNVFDDDEVVILAPRFLAAGDESNSSERLLRWNETHPIPHTWRYGADAINANVSSYQALDAMIGHLVHEQFPSLERVVITGHSAGGQFAQRWALTSSHAMWESPQVSVRVIVANPRSFCYLDDRRFWNGTLRKPPQEAIDSCPGYNSWEWGLDAGGDLATPYKDRELRKIGGAARMASRYTRRFVYYLAGELDVLPVHASCEDDEFQGRNRRERSKLFFQSISATYSHRHLRFVVPDVPHDHCLIFQSETFRTLLLADETDSREAESSGPLRQNLLYAL